jgi:SAM-dependent methyltransferase
MASSLPSSPAALRNRDPIAAVLRTLLPQSGLVLEIASGTGEHLVHFAGQFPHLLWQPTDPDPEALAIIAARRENSGLGNIEEPQYLDAASDAWPVAHADALVCINMVHISPWEATQGLIRGAVNLLPAAAPIFLYGPFVRAGVPTAASNLAFDQSLRGRNPAWGLRSVEDLVSEAAANGIRFERLVEMPAKNLSLIFRR